MHAVTDGATFLPHGFCLSWDPLLLWTLVASNALIGLAYFSIPVALFYFIRRHPNLRFNWLFLMFGLFILACGTAHWLGVVDIWVPLYRLDAAVLAVTAAVSVATAAALWPMLPKVSAFLKGRVSTEQDLSDANQRLNESLQQLEQRRAQLEESERRFRLTFENAPIGLAMVGLDGRFLDVNQGLCTMLGYTEAELLEHSFQDITHPDDLQKDLANVDDLLAGRSDSYRMDKRYFHKSGYVINVQLDVAILRDDHGKPIHFISQIQDVTGRRRAESELRDHKLKLEKGFAQLVQTNQEITTLGELSGILQACQSIDEVAAPLGTFVRALFPGYAGALYLLHSSRNYLEAIVRFGDAANEPSPSEPARSEPARSEPVFAPDACWALRRGMLHWAGRDGLQCAHLQGGAGSGAQVCIPIVAQGDTIGLAYLQARRDQGLAAEDRQHLEQLAAMVADRVGIAIANIKLRQTLRLQSIRDPLTGLFNRRYLEETLPRELGLAARGGHALSLLMIDVDHFKGFNDLHGHEAGDQALRLIGGQIAMLFRDSDIACRFGGEEFAVVLPAATLSQAHAKAEELRRQIASLQLSGTDQPTGPVTISVGVAQYRGHGATIRDLIGAADRALYGAKRAGRNCVLSAEAAAA